MATKSALMQELADLKGMLGQLLQARPSAEPVIDEEPPAPGVRLMTARELDVILRSDDPARAVREREARLRRESAQVPARQSASR